MVGFRPDEGKLVSGNSLLKRVFVGCDANGPTPSSVEMTTQLHHK